MPDDVIRASVLPCVKYTNMNIALLTCYAFPNLIEADQKLIPELALLGFSAEAVIWDDPEVNWKKYDIAIIRNTWDYFQKTSVFYSWLEKMNETSCSFINPLSVIRWNMHKFYLREMSDAGILVIPSLFLPYTSTPQDINSLIPSDWSQIIIKPAISAGSYLTELMDINDMEAIIIKYGNMVAERDIIIQKFIPEIVRNGEISMVFFDKKFSHAVVKKPKSGDFRIQSQFGGKYQAFIPDANTLNAAQDILNYVKSDLIYARVDGIISDNKFYLMELELIEPDLYMDFIPNGQVRFAESISRAISM